MSYAAARKPDAGQYGVRCYRTSCQAVEGVVYLNRATNQHYCGACARLINEANPPALCAAAGLPYPLCELVMQ